MIVRLNTLVMSSRHIIKWEGNILRTHVSEPQINNRKTVTVEVPSTDFTLQKFNDKLSLSQSRVK